MKKILMKTLLPLVLGVATAASAMAQAWPTKPVRVVIPFPPGGTLDTVGRLLAQKLGEQTGQTFVIDNKPGGNGMTTRTGLVGQACAIALAAAATPSTSGTRVFIRIFFMSCLLQFGECGACQASTPCRASSVFMRCTASSGCSSTLAASARRNSSAKCCSERVLCWPPTIVK